MMVGLPSFQFNEIYPVLQGAAMQDELTPVDILKDPADPARDIPDQDASIVSDLCGKGQGG